MKKELKPARVVVKMRSHNAEASKNNWDFVNRNALCELEKLNKKFPDASISPLFTSLSQNSMKKLTRKALVLDQTYIAPDFRAYYAVDFSRVEPADVLHELQNNAHVDLSYIETGFLHPPFNRVAKTVKQCRQHYLENAPTGISAKSVWDKPGGDGLGKIRFIDIEQGWILNHESYQISTFPVSGLNASFFSNHGAAVLGLLIMNKRGSNCRGIVPRAAGHVVSQWRPGGIFNTADAIMAAIHHLKYGDILLIEAQVPDQSGGPGLWPVEIQEACFQTIRLATALGITVIEAAGNGDGVAAGSNLDDFQQDGAHLFRLNTRGFRDSGAMLVAAATAFAPHRRISFSNFGARIDCFAQGEDVYTAGSFPATGRSPRKSYTPVFGGTSAAAAIIAGAAIATQSMASSLWKHCLSPAELRTLLSHPDYSTPSHGGRLSDRIGSMPDLQKIAECLRKRSGSGKMKKGDSTWPINSTPKPDRII